MVDPRKLHIICQSATESEVHGACLAKIEGVGLWCLNPETLNRVDGARELDSGFRINVHIVLQRDSGV